MILMMGIVIFMARFLAAGVPAEITVYGSFQNGERKLKQFKQGMQKYTDLNLYTEEFYENCVDYKLKPEIFNENIYKTLTEFKKYTLLDPSDLFDHDILNENQDTYPWHLVHDYDYYGEKCSGFIMEDDFKELSYMCPPEQWLVADCDLHYQNVNISIGYVTLWSDWFSYDDENESSVLRILNRFKKEVLKKGNILTKTIMFFVEG